MRARKLVSKFDKLAKNHTFNKLYTDFILTLFYESLTRKTAYFTNSGTRVGTALELSQNK